MTKRIILLISFITLLTNAPRGQEAKKWRVDESTIIVEADSFLHFDADGRRVSIEAFNDSLQTGKYIITSRGDKRLMKDYLTYKHPTADSLKGRHLPQHTFTDIDGVPVHINNADITVICSWNKYCGICIAELNVLDILSEDFPHVQFIAITGDSETDVRHLLDDACWKWRTINVVIDPERSLMRHFQIITDPSCLIVNRRGEILTAHFGGNIRELVSKLDRTCTLSSR